MSQLLTALHKLKVLQTPCSRKIQAHMLKKTLTGCPWASASGTNKGLPVSPPERFQKLYM